jgi:TetR/AcrR family fatty acid metabolism transcriptional regulator
MTEQSVINEACMSKAGKLHDKEKKRIKIMQAALKIFSRKGYSPAAVDEVAREAGIAKGTLYLYFQDKEDLFFSTIMYVFDNLASMMESNINESANPLEILENLAFCQLQFFSQNRDFFGIFQTVLNENLLSTHKKMFNEILKKKTGLLDYESKIVDRGKREGFIRKDIETQDIVISFDGMVGNTIKLMGCSGDPVAAVNVENRVKSIMKILLQGVADKKGWA